VFPHFRERLTPSFEDRIKNSSPSVSGCLMVSRVFVFGSPRSQFPFQRVSDFAQ
jgi:hypothetical protein